MSNFVLILHADVSKKNLPWTFLKLVLIRHINYLALIESKLFGLYSESHLMQSLIMLSKGLCDHFDKVPNNACVHYLRMTIVDYFYHSVDLISLYIWPKAIVGFWIFG
jgi:hypothetical protein